MYRVSWLILWQTKFMGNLKPRCLSNVIQLIIGALLLFAILSNAGCGFKLRGGQALPDGITQIYLSSQQDFTPFRQSVEKYLDLYQIPWVDTINGNTKDSTVGIFLMPDSLDRRLLSLFPTGQVAEYELVLSIRYQVAFPNEEPQFVEFDVTREYQDDPDAILAKSRELDLVLSELRQQAADKMIRMLPSLSRANPASE